MNKLNELAKDKLINLYINDKKSLEEWHKLHKFHLYSGTYETKDLANFLGVTPRTIQRWLKEKTKPSKEQLAQIKRYLAKKDSKISL